MQGASRELRGTYLSLRRSCRCSCSVSERTAAQKQAKALPLLRSSGDVTAGSDSKVPCRPVEPVFSRMLLKTKKLGSRNQCNGNTRIPAQDRQRGLGRRRARLSDCLRALQRGASPRGTIGGPGERGSHQLTGGPLPVAPASPREIPGVKGPEWDLDPNGILP